MGIEIKMKSFQGEWAFGEEVNGGNCFQISDFGKKGVNSEASIVLRKEKVKV